MARFNKYSTARSTGLVYSYGLLPVLIYSLRFDDSGICPVALSCLILIFSTVFHVWYRDWAYQFYLIRLKRSKLAEYKAAQASRLKRNLEIKQNRDQMRLENNHEEEKKGNNESSSEENEMSMIEMHDFRPNDEEAHHITDPSHFKAKAALALGGSIKTNKVVPIMEVPSSESERSSCRNMGAEPYSARQYAGGSVRSHYSYGF